jgi:phosphoribosylglycinamide formyltransferase-1
MSRKKRIAIMISGTGTNMQALIDAQDTLNGDIVLVMSSREEAKGLERARDQGIDGICIEADKFEDRAHYEQMMLNTLEAYQVDLIVLAGYMRILGDKFIKTYANRMINVHPALLPSFGGPGYYGLRVHEAVLDAGVKVTGATVHFVTIEPDAGPIIAQECVRVHQGDTPQVLQKRVLEVEHRLLAGAVRLFCQDRLLVKGNIVDLVGMEE